MGIARCRLRQHAGRWPQRSIDALESCIAKSSLEQIKLDEELFLSLFSFLF